MKAIFISFSLSFIAWRCVAAASPFIQKTDQFQPNQNQTVILQTPFGQPFFIGKADLSKLGGKQIHHIDLVYTSYKSSASFDQAKLNKQRMNELRKLLPDIDTDNPHWTWIEQTGAKDLATAATFFHGFVVHYTERNQRWNYESFLRICRCL